VGDIGQPVQHFEVLPLGRTVVPPERVAVPQPAAEPTREQVVDPPATE
jgi:hypothetical protein